MGQWWLHTQVLRCCHVVHKFSSTPSKQSGCGIFLTALLYGSGFTGVQLRIFLTVLLYGLGLLSADLPICSASTSPLLWQLTLALAFDSFLLGSTSRHAHFGECISRRACLFFSRHCYVPLIRSPFSLGTAHWSNPFHLASMPIVAPLLPLFPQVFPLAPPGAALPFHLSRTLAPLVT